MKNYNRNIAMRCPVCASVSLMSDLDNNDLAVVPENAQFICAECHTVVTKQELLKSNEKLIEANIEGMVREVKADLEKDLQRIFRKWK